MQPWEKYAGGDAKPWEKYASTPEPAKPAAAPAQEPEGTATDFIAGNLNKGLAGVAGMPVDTAQNIYNLGKAAVGTATGRPQDFPLVEGTPGGSQWIEGKMRGAGMIRPGAEPQSKVGEYGARALQFGAGAMVPMSRFSAAGRIPTPPTSMAGRIAQPVKDVAATVAPRFGMGATSGLAAQAAEDIGGPEYAPIGAMLPGVRQKAPGAGERGAQARQASRYDTARQEGIPIPPRLMKPDQQQQRVQDIVTKQLGIPPGTEIEPKMLAANRAHHWDAYQALIEDPALAQGIVPNKRFIDAITELGAETRGAQRALPETFKNTQGVMKLLSDYVQGTPMPPKVAVRAIKKLRGDATTNLSSDKPEQVSLGQAQRKIAVSLENLIEDNLGANPESLQRFRQARTAIAQSHDVESSLDPVTRKIDSAKLSALLTEGRPLSGGLKNIADIQGQFPGAMKQPKGDDDIFTKRMSPYAVTHPGAAAAHGLSRMTDPITTSSAYQRLFVDPATKVTPDQERLIRLLLSGQAGQQAQIPRPPE